MHSFALVANMDKQWSWNKVYELRKILKDKKTRIVKGKDGKIKGGVDIVDGSDLYNKYSKELADLEAKMARAKESRNGHNTKQLVVKAVVCSDQMPIMNKVPLPATTVVKQEALLLVPPAVKQDAAMPVLPLLEKEEISTAADNWNDPEARPSWLDERTQMSRTEYLSYRTVITKECRDMFDYRVFLPHQAPNCGMSTTFGDLCDFLCEPLKHAHKVRDKRRGLVGSAEPWELVGSAELPISLKLKLWAANKEQDALLKEMDITLFHLYNCAAMNTVYDLLSTAWKMRLQKKQKVVRPFLTDAALAIRKLQTAC